MLRIWYFFLSVEHVMRTAAWKVTCPARYTVDWACARNGGSVHSTEKPKGLTVSLSICGNAQCDQETKVSVRAWERSFSSQWHVAKNLVGKLEKVDTRKMEPSRTLKILQLCVHSAFLLLWDLKILAHECNRATSLGLETI
jgi:hypothetical protein